MKNHQNSARITSHWLLGAGTVMVSISKGLEFETLEFLLYPFMSKFLHLHQTVYT